MAPALTFYDNYTRSFRRFEALGSGAVGLYTCGPTVYDYQHIGNFRTFLFEDLLKRVLEWNGYAVRHVMNITDVGHLTSDADTGEDKMLAGARRTGKSAWEIAALYTEAFLEDLRALNIEEPTLYCRATDHIAEQIEFIADIERNGYTYRTSDGIYFDTSRQPDYGFLARLDKAGLEAGKRVELGEKRHGTDFALWKFSPPGEKRQMEWPSPWGIGFPGWHIECSAMAQKYLGDFFDIHCGGEDHIPVHHTNEIAQSECAFDVHPWVRYWLHNEFYEFGGEKMAKSTGNVVLLEDLVERGFEPLAFRYFFLQGHYRQQQSFTLEAMEAAATGYRRLLAHAAEVRSEEGEANRDRIAPLCARFREAVRDDLNAPRALAVAWEAARGPELSPADKRSLLLEFDAWLGLGLATEERRSESDPRIDGLLARREAAREAREFATADRIRKELEAEGILIEDTPEGPRWRRR